MHSLYFSEVPLYLHRRLAAVMWGERTVSNHQQQHARELCTENKDRQILWNESEHHTATYVCMYLYLHVHTTIIVNNHHRTEGYPHKEEVDQ